MTLIIVILLLWRWRVILAGQTAPNGLPDLCSDRHVIASLRSQSL